MEAGTKFEVPLNRLRRRCTPAVVMLSLASNCKLLVIVVAEVVDSEGQVVGSGRFEREVLDGKESSLQQRMGSRE